MVKKQQAREKKAKDYKSKKQAKKIAFEAEVKAATQKLAKNRGEETKLNVKELKALIRSLKQDGDDPIPSKRAELLTRFREIRSQMSSSSALPTRTSRPRRSKRKQHKSDSESESELEESSDKESEEDEEESGEVVEEVEEEGSDSESSSVE
jgi:hypothetical protein